MYADLTRMCCKCKTKESASYHRWCKYCLSESKKKAYLKNKGHYNAKSKEWYWKNREKSNLLSKMWRKENKSRMSELCRKYRSTEKGKEARRADNKRRYESGYRKAWNYIRRRGIENATPDWVNRKELIQFFKNRPSGYHVDHIVPLRGKNVCGLNVIWNLQYLTASENLRKSNKG